MNLPTLFIAVDIPAENVLLGLSILLRDTLTYIQMPGDQGDTPTSSPSRGQSYQTLLLCAGGA